MLSFISSLVTNQPLYDAAYRQWFAEYDHPLPEGKTYEYGIVLGGYSHWDWERNRIEFSNIANLTDTPVKVDDRRPSWFRRWRSCCDGRNCCMSGWATRIMHGKEIYNLFDAFLCFWRNVVIFVVEIIGIWN